MTIKKIFSKIIHIIKIIILSIFSFFFNIFSKKNKISKSIPKNSNQTQIIKNKKDVSSSLASPNTEPASLKNSHLKEYQKTPEELKIIISKIYYNEKKIELNNEENPELKQITSFLIPKLEQEIKEKNITNDEQLNTKITTSLSQITKIETKNKPLENNLSEPTTQTIFNNLNSNTQNDNTIFKQNTLTDVKKKETTTTKTPPNLDNPNPAPTSKETIINNPTNSKYLSITPLKNYFVAKTITNEYILIDDKMQELTSHIPYEIVDFHDKYLKVQNNKHYYIYKFNGEKLREQEYLDIKLFDKFYTVITKDHNLDIHKYHEPKYKLETPLPVSPANYHQDYEIETLNKDYHVKINHNKSEYLIDAETGIIKNTNLEKTIDLPTDHIKEPEISNFQYIKTEIAPQNEDKPIDFEPLKRTHQIAGLPENSNKLEEVSPSLQENQKEIEISIPLTSNLTDIETLDEETVLTSNEIEESQIEKAERAKNPETKETINNEPQTIDPKSEINPKNEPKTEKKKPEIEPKETKELQKEPEQSYENLNLIPLNNQTDLLQNNLNKTIEKEDLEDKNYDELLNEVEYLLTEIAVQKKKKLSPHDTQKLFLTEQKILNLKNKILNHEELDIKKERDLLREELRQNELYELETTLEKLHFEHQIELNNHTLKKLEDLNFIDKDKARQIEKALLKSKIKKARRAMEISSILSLPFIRNKYFLYFTMSLFVSNHLHLFDNILKHKTENYTKEDLSTIKVGESSLNEALNLTTNNLEILEKLEYEASNKFPELTIDSEYRSNLTTLKNALTAQELKMVKKKKMLEKYNLEQKQYNRVLKKDQAA